MMIPYEDDIINDYIKRLITIVLIRLLVRAIPIPLPPFPWPPARYEE